MAKIRQNNQFRQAGFALTNLTKIRQNREIHKHSLGLTSFDKRNTVGILAQNKTFCDQNCLRTQPSLDWDSRYGN